MKTALSDMQSWRFIWLTDETTRLYNAGANPSVYRELKAIQEKILTGEEPPLHPAEKQAYSEMLKQPEHLQDMRCRRAYGSIN